MHSVSELTEILRQGTVHLVKMSDGLNYPWNPEERDPRKLHNMYARSLVSCYVSKFAQLSEAMLDGIKNERFMVYALAGRSLVESVATLRYYLFNRYKPLLDKKTLTSAEMTLLLEIDDQHLRGGRFNWEAFFERRYEELTKDAVHTLANKRNKSKEQFKTQLLPTQTNVLTCIESWGAEEPGVIVIYNMLCDLVHPNIGSAFLVASVKDDFLYFSPSKGNSIGAQIFEQSLPLLLSITMKPFGAYLFHLISTIYHDDEL
jgi:hypothetical protein